jgi:hypothetical protein
MKDENREQYPGVGDLAARAAEKLLDLVDEAFSDVFVPYANRLINDGYLEFDLSFPVEWRFGDNPSDGMGGPAPDDAGTIQVLMDYCDGDLVLVGSTSLNEMVNRCLEGWEGPNAKTDEGHVEASNALSAALRAAADRLDAALPEITKRGGK